jgi:predicted TIM-barrel fold metal-dependent hydrolase
MAKLMMISADTHAGPAPHEYADWLDPKYRDGVDDLIKHTEWFQSIAFEAAPDEAARKIVDTRGVMASGGMSGVWDPARRLAELEAEGFVAELIFPGDPSTIGMYFSNLNRPCSAEYRAAGVKAHNRWLAEFCSYAPGRMLGVAQMEPWPDIQACVRDVAWAKQAGMGAVSMPRFTGIEENQPPVTSPQWEPFWQACVDNDIAVSFHVGHLHPQGGALEVLEAANMKVTGFQDPATDGIIHYDAGRRPFWQLVLAGVFDRYPTLRATFTEFHCEWIPATLAHLERRFDEVRFSESGLRLPKLRPTDYWRRNCGVAAQLRPYEVALRGQIGMETVMFGTDYPHPEGTWPNTREWLQGLMQGVPEAEVRMILGENAARMYGFDAQTLAPHVERVGLEPAELIDEHPVPKQLIDNFQWRSGYLNRAFKYDPDVVEPIIREDEKSIIAAA